MVGLSRLLELALDLVLVVAGLVVNIMVLLMQDVLVMLGRVLLGIISIGALFNDKVSARVLDYLLPLGPNFLILNLWSATVNSLH